MTVIPAIDLMDGQCVRLKQGAFAKRTTYTPKPLDMAQLFERMGYEWLHIIDLDGANKGSSQNQQVMAEILAQTKMKVQVGGGIRSLEDIKRLLDLGMSRVILGTIAVKDPQLVQKAIERFGAEKIIIALDIRDEDVRISGWKESTSLKPEDFLKQLKEMGVKNILATDIAKDGMTGGPRPEFYKRLITAFPDFYWIAAGGIRTANDQKKLAEVGVDASILGSIFYEGSLLAKRIIPCLDVKNGRTVKGVNFKDLRDAGDPIELGKMYRDQGADELTFLDITATSDKRKTVSELAKRVAKEIDIPFTIGGGIASIEDIRAILKAGADKVSLGSAIVQNPDLINEAAEQFGSQCIVASIDAKKVDNSWRVTIRGGRETTDLDALEWAKEVEKRGAGEILLNSMDKDGTKKGFDIQLLRAVSAVTSIPIIASGGAGSIEDFIELFESGFADAGLAASIFHFGILPIPELKEALMNRNITLRS